MEKVGFGCRESEMRNFSSDFGTQEPMMRDQRETRVSFSIPSITTNGDRPNAEIPARKEKRPDRSHIILYVKCRHFRIVALKWVEIARRL